MKLTKTQRVIAFNEAFPVGTRVRVSGSEITSLVLVKAHISDSGDAVARLHNVRSLVPISMIEKVDVCPHCGKELT